MKERHEGRSVRSKADVVSVNPLTSQRTALFSFKDLPLLIYAIADEHKPLHKPRVFIDMSSDTLKLG